MARPPREGLAQRFGALDLGGAGTVAGAATTSTPAAEAPAFPELWVPSAAASKHCEGPTSAKLLRIFKGGLIDVAADGQLQQGAAQQVQAWTPLSPDNYCATDGVRKGALLSEHLCSRC